MRCRVHRHGLSADAILVAQAYPEWAGSATNSSCGEFPQTESEPASLYFHKGLSEPRPVAINTSSIVEHVRHSWYEGEAAFHHPRG
jgi:[NiFe] hydrogenase large subunit